MTTQTTPPRPATARGFDAELRRRAARPARPTGGAASPGYITGLRDGLRAEVTATRKAIAGYTRGLAELRADRPDDYVVAALTSWTMRGLAYDIADHRLRVGMYSDALCGEAAAAQLLGREARP